MADETIDKVQIEVQASARGTDAVFKQLESHLGILKKAFDAIDTSKLAKIQKAVNAASPKLNTSGMSKSEREIDASIKKIQESMAGLKTYAEKAMGGDKSAFSTYDKQATSLQSTMDKLAEKLKNFGNAAVPTKAFEKLDSEIESTRSHLEDLKAQEKEALEKGGTSDYEMVQLGFAIQETEDKLKSLGAEQDKLINEGKAFYDPYEPYRESLDQLQAKLSDTTTQIQTAMTDIANAQPTGTPLDAVVEKLQNELPAAISKIQQDFAGLGSYAEAALGGDKSAFTSFERRVTSIQSAIDVVANKLQQLEGAGVSTEGLESYRAALQAIQEQLGATSNAVQAAYAQMNNVPAPEVSKEADKASSSMHRLASSRTGLEGISKSLSKIKDHLKGISIHGPNMGKLFKTILKYGFGIRSLYVLFRRLRKAVVESFGELQNSGAFFQTTRANIEALKASLTTLKFQFGAAFEPIFNAVAPALQTLINYLITVMNVISAFTAKLMGKSTYSKAVANMTALGGATGGAAKAQKELNKQLQGFDELNNLTTNNPSGGGGGGGGGGDAAGAHYVEESVDSVLGDFGKQLADQIRAGDWEGVGKAISDKLSEAMESIPWDKVYEKARNFGKGLADFLNGLINPRLFGNVGTTLANSINTAFEFLNSFGTTFDWTNFGTSIGEGISKFFKNADFALWGDTVHTWIAGLLDAGIALVDNTDWALIGTKLGEFLENLDIPDLVKKLGTLAIKIIEGLGEALLNLAGSSTAGAIASSIAVVLGGLVFWNKLGNLVGNIGAALGIANWSGKIPSSCGANMLGEIGTQLDGGSLSLGTLTLLVGEFILVGNIASAILEKLYIDSGDEEGARYQEEYGTHPIKAAGEIISSIFDGSFTGGVKGLWNAFQNSDFITHLGDSFFAGWDFLFGGSAASAPEGKKLQGGYTPSILDAGGTSMLGAWNSFFGTGNTSSGFFKGIGKSLDTINKKFQTTGKTQDKFLETTQKGSKTSGKALKDNYDTGAIKPVGEAFSKVYDAVSKIWSKSGEDSKKYSYDFYTGFNSMPDETSARFALGYSQSTGKWSAFGDWVKDKANTINRGFDGTPTETSNKFGEAYNQSTNKWTNIGNWIKEKANIVNTGFNGFPSATATKFGEAYTQGTSKFNNTGSWIQGVYNTISQKISAVPGEFDAKFKSAADNATKQTKTFTDWFQNVNLTREASLSFSASGSNDFNIGSIVNSVNNVIHKFNESISLAIGKMNAANKGRMTLSFTAAKDIYVPYARGGVIDSATLALMGEAGTEAVVPLENNTKWLGKMADMMVGEMVKPQHLNIASAISNTSGGNADASSVAEQNALLREEVQLLRQIAGKELTISSSEVFKATQAESNNYYNRTGNSPFLF